MATKRIQELGALGRASGDPPKKLKTRDAEESVMNIHNVDESGDPYVSLNIPPSTSEKTVTEKHLDRNELTTLVKTQNCQNYVWELKSGGKTSLKDIKSAIEADLQVQFSDRICHLYPAFKRALTTLIADIEEAMSSDVEMVIVIHGAVKIGKSMLARSLAHYLAFTGEKTYYTKFGHNDKVDKDDLTDAIVECMQSKWVILDQCNVNRINYTEIRHILAERIAKYQTPVLMFTSGQYAPAGDWKGLEPNSVVNLKVIDMKLDLATLQAMRTSVTLGKRNGQRGVEGSAYRAQGQDVSDEDLLKLTSNYGRLMKCVCKLADNPECTLKDVETAIYGMQYMDLLLEEKNIHIIYVNWPNFECGLPEQDKLETIVDRKLATDIVEYLGHVASRHKDHGVNNVFNVMDIGGKQVEGTLADGFCQYKVDSYHYIVAHIRPIYDILKKVWHSYDPYEAYDACLKTFKQLQYSQRSMLGELFKILIQLSCDIKQIDSTVFGVAKREGNAEVEFVNVKFSNRTSSVDELCNTMKDATLEGSEFSVWCQLNINRQSQFPGYDYALFTVSNRKVICCQLFRASIDPEGISHEQKNIMVRVLKDIRKRLKDMDVMLDTRKVVAYFLCPHETPVSVKEMDLGSDGIVAHSVCFQQMRIR